MIAEIAVMMVPRELFLFLISFCYYCLVVAGMTAVGILATHVRYQVTKCLLHSYLDFYKLNVPTVVI